MEDWVIGGIEGYEEKIGVIVINIINGDKNSEISRWKSLTNAPAYAHIAR